MLHAAVRYPLPCRSCYAARRKLCVLVI